MNKDSVHHTVTSKQERLFDVHFDGGATLTFTRKIPGSLYPAMVATLVVE